MLFSRPGKEPLGGCDVTPFAQEKIDGSALLIDGAIEVDPLAFDLDVGFIHAPGVADRPCVMVPALFKLRHVLLHPPQMVVWAKVMPRSAIIRTRSRELSLNVRYHRTQSTMISWSKCRPLKRSCAEVGSVIPAVIARHRAFQQFAPEPYGGMCRLYRRVESGLDRFWRRIESIRSNLELDRKRLHHVEDGPISHEVLSRRRDRESR